MHPLRDGSRPALALVLTAGVVLAMAGPASAVAPPSVTGLSPAVAPVGALVTLTGAALGATSSVSFNGVAAPFTVADDTTVTATVPAGASDGLVTVVTPDGTAGLAFDVDEPPAPVSGLVARAGESAVRLTWTAAADVTAVVVRRAEGTTPPAGPTDGVAVASGLATGLTDTGLVDGRTYAYSVWARDAAGSLSTPASVTATPVPAAATALRIGLSAATVAAGGFVAVSGVLTGPSGAGLAGEQVTLLTRPRGAAAFAGTATGVTDAAGAVRFGVNVTRHTDFLLRHAGGLFTRESASAVAQITARHGLVARLVPSVVELGGTALVEGRVGPAVSGVRVRLERRYGTAWYAVTSTVTDVRGGFRFAVRPPSGGEQVLRVVTTADAGHLAAAGTPLRLTILARTLRAGMSGADVLALERRLTELRYDVGPMGGVYDYDTRLAVMAFQKVHGLPRTGVADAVTRSRLGFPVAPRLRRPVLGLSVEIDLTRQVLLYARSGVVQRILPVSSGNNELYTVDGVTSRAVTPTGSFRIQRKINGIRVSRLGQLFQPAYFVGGYAIHGSPSVPGHPASHGCIRVTQPAMNRLFPLLPVGTPVTIYYS